VFRVIRRNGIKSIFQKLMTAANTMKPQWQIFNSYRMGRLYCVYSAWKFQIYLRLCGASKTWLYTGLHLNGLNNHLRRLCLPFSTSKRLQCDRKNFLTFKVPESVCFFTVHQCCLGHEDWSIIRCKLGVYKFLNDARATSQLAGARRVTWSEFHTEEPKYLEPS
jgi:hypothetical protein